MEDICRLNKISTSSLKLTNNKLNGKEADLVEQLLKSLQPSQMIDSK